MLLVKQTAGRGVRSDRAGSADGRGGFDDRGGAGLERAVAVLAGELERAGGVLAGAFGLVASGERFSPAKLRPSLPDEQAVVAMKVA
jgi:hypothetical protein